MYFIDRATGTKEEVTTSSSDKSAFDGQPADTAQLNPEAIKAVQELLGQPQTPPEAQKALGERALGQPRKAGVTKELRRRQLYRLATESNGELNTDKFSSIYF